MAINWEQHKFKIEELAIKAKKDPTHANYKKAAYEIIGWYILDLAATNKELQQKSKKLTAKEQKEYSYFQRQEIAAQNIRNYFKGELTINPTEELSDFESTILGAINVLHLPDYFIINVICETYANDLPLMFKYLAEGNNDSEKYYLALAKVLLRIHGMFKADCMSYNINKENNMACKKTKKAPAKKAKKTKKCGCGCCCGKKHK